MEKWYLVVWKHPDAWQCRLPWRLSQEYAGIEDRLHREIRVLRGDIKVLERLPNFPSDVQALRTFFLDFSHQGLFGGFSSFNTASGQEEVPAIAYRSNPAIAI
jgi:hypothetical protein